MGWEELENGELLSAAEASDFAVMVTGDKNLSYQQSLQGRKLVFVVLSTNDWRVLRDNPIPLVEAVNAATPGSFRFVSFDPPAGFSSR